MNGRPLVFVDVETTGLSARDGHILEIGAVRVENGKIVAEYKQLLDPGVDVPWFITNLTGIRTSDVSGQPQFRQVADEVERLFEDSIFVTHNVGFDYSFFASEFKRLGHSLDMDHFCTAKLSRLLHPEHRRHTLDALIDRGGYEIANRHRAYDDAYVLYQFYRDALQQHGDNLYEAVQKILIHTGQTPKERLTYVPMTD